MTPAVGPAHILTAWFIAEAGFRGQASEILGLVARQGTPFTSWALFLKLALEGDAEEALRHATPEMERSIQTDHFIRIHAAAYALIERPAEAIRWTGTAIERGLITYPCLARHDPFLAGVRDEPEFQDLMAQLKGRWEAVVEWERRLD